MNILITGVCGFAGSRIALTLQRILSGATIVGVDNLSRPGSETNRAVLREHGIRVLHGDLRLASDVAALPDADWVVDAAANPSVLAGVDGKSSPRQLLEHNLWGSVEILEYCRRCGAGFILLSSSRVYSVRRLAQLPMIADEESFRLAWDGAPWPAGLSEAGIRPEFSTEAPVSLYGSTKLASEALAFEYAEAFGLRVWVNRCGVLAGAGQFGTADQGIFAYWIHSYFAGERLRYLGFGGKGLQVRDALHPDDLARLVAMQIESGRKDGTRLYTVGGGIPGAMSLAQLTRWCGRRFGRPHAVEPDSQPRRYDIPWVVMDSAAAAEDFGWTPEIALSRILEEIAEFAERNPGWLDLSRSA